MFVNNLLNLIRGEFQFEDAQHIGSQNSMCRCARPAQTQIDNAIACEPEAYDGHGDDLDITCLNENTAINLVFIWA